MANWEDGEVKELLLPAADEVNQRLFRAVGEKVAT